MKLIDVSTRKHPNTFTMVDDADFDWLNQWKWNQSKNGYAQRRARSESGVLGVYMHREIMRPVHGIHIDHINGDRLDNRRENLRFCTVSQNLGNSKIPITNSSGFKGIAFHKSSGLWMARVRHENVRHFFGYYRTKIEAAKAYDAGAFELKGKFALTNEMLGRYIHG